MAENASLHWKAWHCGPLLAGIRAALVLIARGDVDCAEVVGILSIRLGVLFLSYEEALLSFLLFFLLSAV